MALIAIAGLDDPRLDAYRNLSDAELLSARGLFMAEGRLVVRRLLTESRFRAQSVLVTPAARAALAALESAPGMPPVYEVAQPVMNAVTGFNIHRGCLAVGERGAALDWRAAIDAAQTMVVLERVADPDNVGAIFRSAAALGAAAVLLDPQSTDPLYRKAIRTSMGAALHLPFARLADWPADLHRLRAAGVTLVALTPAADAVALDTWVAACIAGRGEAGGPARAQPSCAPTRVALLLGHEGEGLSEAAMAAADVRVRIPVSPAVDSLNVAVAGAIALYEVSRLRAVGASAG